MPPKADNQDHCISGFRQRVQTCMCIYGGLPYIKKCRWNRHGIIRTIQMSFHCLPHGAIRHSMGIRSGHVYLLSFPCVPEIYIPSAAWLSLYLLPDFTDTGPAFPSKTQAPCISGLPSRSVSERTISSRGSSKINGMDVSSRPVIL